jgi:hypothetical protein
MLIRYRYRWVAKGIQTDPVDKDANSFAVTIVRPKTDEVPQKARIGLEALAKLIAAGIREESQEPLGVKERDP